MDRRCLLTALGSTLLGHAIANQHAAAHPIAISTYVPVPGAKLYVEIRGGSSVAPLLIWLHGGPGGAERPLFRLYNAALEERFVVVYYDQRGAGRSFDPKADPAALTVKRHLDDLRMLIRTLRARGGSERIVLLGHSWGSALGLLYASTFPDDISGFMGVGQLTCERARQQSQFDFVMTQAQRRRDERALTRLKQIGPPPFDATRELAIQRLVDDYGGYWRRKPALARILVRGLTAKVISPWEIARFIRANTVTLHAMDEELLALDLPASVKSVDTPVAFLLGRHDRQVDSRLAAAYFEQLHAPGKALVWFEQAAHNIPFEAPRALNAAVVELARRMDVLA